MFAGITDLQPILRGEIPDMESEYMGRRHCHTGRKHMHRPSVRVIQRRQRGREMQKQIQLAKRRKKKQMVADYFAGKTDEYPYEHSNGYP